MRQINQPDDKDEGVEIHAVPYDTEGSHQAQLKFRVKGARQMSMKEMQGWHLSPWDQKAAGVWGGWGVGFLIGFCISAFA